MSSPSSPLRPYMLISLVAVILLEPVIAKKWRFPFKRGSVVADAASITATSTATTSGTTAACASGDVVAELACEAAATGAKGASGMAQGFGPLLLMDWNQMRAWPGMQLPLQAANWAKAVILYQPPVGIVAAWTTFRLLRSGRIFQWDETDKDPRIGHASEQALSQKSSKLDRHFGRALDLDRDDIEYQKFGGIERVRRRLLWHALEQAKVDLPRMDTGLLDELVESLLELMKVSFPPGGSHADYLLELLNYMPDIEHYWVQYTLLHQSKTTPESLARLLEIAIQTAENRVLDSMVRLTRDRFVRTCFRLSRTVQHWQTRVGSQSGVWPLLRRFMLGSFEGDRMRLAFAESAYRSEVTRLGKVINLLSERPLGMDDSFLQLAVQRTLATESTQPKPPPTTNNNSNNNNFIWSKIVPHLPDVSNWSIRFNADGRGKIQVQKYEESLHIGGPGAWDVLLHESDQRQWLQASSAWSQQARKVLVDILEETLETSIQAKLEYDTQIQTLKSSWMSKEYTTSSRGTTMVVASEKIAKNWQVIFGMIRDLHQFRRVGDGKSVKWKDANVIHWARQWDLLGIPSAALHIVLARIAHNRLMPHWPRMKAFLQETFEVTNEIFQSRFWIPIRDLLTELMYRDTNSLLTGISIADEETSLDFMLRDLNFGDGTPASRHEAIIKATRQYETDMATGLMRHALGGRLIRLILIQVQQLKVGMLHAADTVDVLLRTNRFNIQLLAIIPAFLIVSVGTKVAIRFLFTLRHKDLRPMSSVHGEMKGYLNELESILLLAGDMDHTIHNNKGHGETSTALEALSNEELGEFVLNLYDYLVLLDYSSPQPFPKWQCDGIHQSIVEFLGPRGSLRRMGLHDQVRLIDHIKRKHDDLAKHL